MDPLFAFRHVWRHLSPALGSHPSSLSVPRFAPGTFVFVPGLLRASGSHCVSASSQAGGMAARPQASCPPLAPPSSVAFLRRSSCGVWHFWSSSNAAVVVCALVCLLLLPSCNADKNEDLLAGLNNYRWSQNYTVLATSFGGQCFAEKLAAALKDTPCTNTSAQYSVDDANIAGASRSLQSCRISPENVQDAKILPVCVNDARVQSALVFYITSSQVEYQRYLNSSEYVSAGVGSAGPYFIVILGTAEATGNLAQTLSNGSPTNLLAVSLPLLFAALVAKLLLAGAY